MRKDVEKELAIMKANGLITEVDGPTLSMPPIVVALKSKSPNEVRICVDMREPNRAIKRARYIIPTVVDIIVYLNRAKVFLKVGLRKGYNQLILSQSSKHIRCFTTHVGLFRYQLLCFQIKSDAEIFQNTEECAIWTQSCIVCNFLSSNFRNKVSIFQEYSKNTQIQVNILPFS